MQAKVVIPAKAGIQEKTGFRVKPGMTNATRFMSPCIDARESIKDGWADKHRLAAFQEYKRGLRLLEDGGQFGVNC
jgi:hypothetical protein